jgi:DNA polymerase beta
MEKDFIDLRTLDKTINNNELLITVLNKLLVHIKKQISSTSGEDKKKNMFRSTQIKKGIDSISESKFQIISGDQAKKELKGVGAGTSSRIDEILKTGTLKELEEEIVLTEKDKIINLFTEITGVGEVRANEYYSLGLKTIPQLKKAINDNIIKTTHHIDVGLKYFDKFKERIPYDEIATLGKKMKTIISKEFHDLIIEICGSHRRKMEFSGDIDVLITRKLSISPVSPLKKIIALLKNEEFLIDDLTTSGDTKYMGVTIGGRRIDIRYIDFQSFYPALLYFTGSMTTNKLMRTIAIEKGYTLNEYGIYKLTPSGEKGELVKVNSEKDIFDILGIVYLKPEERTF